MSDPMLRPGTRFCKCSSCGRYFGGVSGFDLHRANGACVDPETITDKKGNRKLWLNERGYWAGRYAA